MARAIMVYRRGSKAFLVPLARVPSGGHIETEPVQVIDLPASPGNIGDAVLLALESSGRSLPEPGSDQLESPAQRAAGAKSWKQFIRGTASCDVEKHESGYVITPLRPERGEGFGYEPDKAIGIALNASPALLGEELLTILEQCEEH
jgi:hypothetical protein